MLEQMKELRATYVQQREAAQVQFQQLVGAIFALDTMIKAHEDELAKITEGECENGEFEKSCSASEEAPTE